MDIPVVCFCVRRSKARNSKPATKVLLRGEMHLCIYSKIKGSFSGFKDILSTFGESESHPTKFSFESHPTKFSFAPPPNK
jgi:hypothetical protein